MELRLKSSYHKLRLTELELIESLACLLEVFEALPGVFDHIDVLLNPVVYPERTWK